MYPGKITLLQSFLWRFTDVIGSAWKPLLFLLWASVCATNRTETRYCRTTDLGDSGYCELHSVFEQNIQTSETQSVGDSISLGEMGNENCFLLASYTSPLQLP